MKRFTEEELARANSVDLLAYVQSRGYAVKRMGGSTVWRNTTVW